MLYEVFCAHLQSVYGRFSIGYEYRKGSGAGFDVLEYENYLLKLFSRGQYT
jgi:hypothetical protein